MICLSWNFRGLGQARAVHALSELVKTHKPTVIFLFETLVHSNKIECLRVKMGFQNALAVDRSGYGGGAAVLWNDLEKCRVTSYSTHHIDLEIEDEMRGKWRLTGFYGMPERNHRRGSWNLLRSLHSRSSLPWCVIGDMNDLLEESDKKGNVEHPAWLFRRFRDAVLDCGLIDIPLAGYPFTWERGKGTPNWVEEKLDRCLVSDAWLNLFPQVKLLNLIAPVSDHSPILLHTVGLIAKKRRIRKFRFKNRWLSEPELQQIVSQAWLELTGATVSKLNSCVDSLFSWGNELALRFRKDIDICKTELKFVRFKTDEASIRYFKELKTKLSHRLDQEATYWRQRSNFFWLKDNDSNTRFFHATASARKKRNEIAGLTTDKGEWVQTDKDIQRVAIDYFKDLYSYSPCKYDEVLDCVDVRIKREENTALLLPFSKDEFKEAIIQMHPDKSPGPDGFNPAFYQRFWDLIGDDVYRDSLEWMNNLCFPSSVNDTNICLIPKLQNSKTMKDYRPIALCNVNYKILSKVLANRLKKLLPRIISQEQSAFVLGRSITDNVLVHLN